MNRDIAALRKDYMLEKLDEKDAAANAIEQFTRWWDEAVASDIIEPNAMTLATASKSGLPSARIVLLKGYNKQGFVFFTNYNSHKGQELEANPHGALVFFWKELERQVRIEGVIEKVSEEESDAYFYSRPTNSRIGTWASPQSKIIGSRDLLEENVKIYTEKFGENIPRPAHWGGYRLVPLMIEFWQGRSSRLHDRIQYTIQQDGNWKIERLAP